jgi:hypothetical protein
VTACSGTGVCCGTRRPGGLCSGSCPGRGRSSKQASKQAHRPRSPVSAVEVLTLVGLIDFQPARRIRALLLGAWGPYGPRLDREKKEALLLGLEIRLACAVGPARGADTGMYVHYKCSVVYNQQSARVQRSISCTRLDSTWCGQKGGRQKCPGMSSPPIQTQVRQDEVTTPTMQPQPPAPVPVHVPAPALPLLPCCPAALQPCTRPPRAMVA